MPDIFDSLDETPAVSKHDVFDEVSDMPSRTRSLISAPIKGAIKGTHDLVSVSDPIKALLGLNEMTPLQKKALEMALPTQDQSLEKGLERAGRIGVSAIGGPESLAAKGLRTAAGAALGQVAEESGAPEWAQTLAELLAFTAPKTGKGLLPSKSQKESVEFLRRKGLSDAEITPLIQSDRKIRALSRLSEKGNKTKKLITDISTKLGDNYELIKDQYKNLKDPFLRGERAITFDQSLEKVLDKISPRFQRLIAGDLEALRNKGISGENLINFYQDINAVVKWQEGGKAVLGLLKKPVLEGLQKINPEIAKDFTKLNEFYSKKALLVKKLKPDMLDNLLSKGKVYATLGSLATGNLGFLKGVVAKEIGSRIFRELLINPRLQNLSNQMLNALSKNQVPTALRIFEIFKKELNKKDTEAAEALNFVEDSEGNRE